MDTFTLSTKMLNVLKFKVMLTIEKKPLVAQKSVSTQNVDKIIRNYKQERWIQNSEKIGKEDSLSLWWSIEELEGFLEQAKRHGGDGVKFYFGAYDADYQEKPEYADRQTLVMVATKQKDGLYGGVANKDIYVKDVNGESKLVCNNGGFPCPPVCGVKITTDPDIYSPEIGITLVDTADGGMMII